MDPLGKLSHMGIAPQADFSTPAAASDYLRFNSESLQLKLDEIVEASIMNRQDESDSVEGSGTVAGNTVHEVHPVGVGYPLRSWFGQPLTVSRTSSTQHQFTPVPFAVPAARKGTATGGTTTTLTDSAAESWVVNQWAGWWLHIIEGTGAEQFKLITSNTATELTFGTLATAPDNTSKYEIIPGPEDCPLPPYTIEVNRNIAGTAAAFQYQGLVANELAFKFGISNKLLELTVNWLGKDGLLIAPTSPSIPTTEPFKWNKCKIGIGSYGTGVATGGSANTIVKALGTYPVDGLIGKLLLKTNSAGKVEIRPITDNDATTITVSPDFVDAGAVDDTYEIFNCPNSVESLDFTLANGLAGLPTVNFTKRISRIVGDSFRSGNCTTTVIPQNITDYSTYYTGWTSRRWLVWFQGTQITGNHYHELAFLFPKVLMTAYPVAVGGPGRITVAIAAKLKYDSTAGYLAKCWLNNNKASYAA